MVVDEPFLRFGWGVAVLAAMVALALTGTHPMVIVLLIAFLPSPALLAGPRRRSPEPEPLLELLPEAEPETLPAPGRSDPAGQR